MILNKLTPEMLSKIIITCINNQPIKPTNITHNKNTIILLFNNEQLTEEFLKLFVLALYKTTNNVLTEMQLNPKEYNRDMVYITSIDESDKKKLFISY